MNDTHQPVCGQRRARLLPVGACLACGSNQHRPDAKPLLFSDWPPGFAAWMCRPCWECGPPEIGTAGAERFVRRLADGTREARALGLPLGFLRAIWEDQR